MRAKKSYGQHFLTNEYFAERIADSLQLTDTYDTVIEVGPGKGVLTKYLLKKDYRLIAVEADEDMVAYLHENYPELEHSIVSADFIRLDLQPLVEGKPFAIIGNYPYNISSQIIFKMLDYKDQVPELVGMFQKEMADRVIAPPGSKTYGVISVLVQAYYAGETVLTVKPGNFNPPPKVNSSVIRLTRKENQDLGCSYKLFRRVVKQSFSQRRKMLRNTLKSIVGSHEFLNDESLKQRPEQLSVEQFVELTNRVEKILQESDR